VNCVVPLKHSRQGLVISGGGSVNSGGQALRYCMGGGWYSEEQIADRLAPIKPFAAGRPPTIRDSTVCAVLAILPANISHPYIRSLRVQIVPQAGTTRCICK